MIVLTYEPRRYFLPFHQRDNRWAILVAHRRAGKTVAAVNDLIEKASYNTRTNPRYGYVAPLYNQAKQIAWQYLKDYAAPFKPKISESGLFVELPTNGARISLYGADNPDAFRGLYFDGLVLDEYGNMRPSVWTEVLLPTLIDRRGWAVFMGTPNGPNHFRDMYDERSVDPEWHTSLMPYTFTRVIPDDDIADIRKQMSEEEFAQEMMCDFAASTRGAFYSKEVARAEQEGRITALDFDTQPLNFALDLGYRDDTSVWAWQARPDGYAFQGAWADSGKPIQTYINQINAFCDVYGVNRGEVYLPHDARAKSLQTGRSIVEQFVEAQILPTIVTNMHITDGIAAARQLFPVFWFDQTRCKDGIRALKSYHRSWDEDKKMFVDAPVHDWSSHFADSFRYASLVMEPPPQLAQKSRQEAANEMKTRMAQGAHYAFNLDDLWKDRASQRSSTRDRW
jgi:phage terminase large subunit